jgi:hypothetical protein
VEIYSPDIVDERQNYQSCHLVFRSMRIWNQRERKGRRVVKCTGFRVNQRKERRSNMFPSIGKEDLLPVVAPHAEDLDHADEDVDEVKLEADTLVDNVTLHVSTLSEAGVVQNLLDIIEGEATEDSQSTVQPDALRPHQCAGSSGGKDHGSETRESDDGNTSEEGTTEVQVLLLLSGSTNESNGTHHADSVKTSASEDSGVHEHQRGEERSLGQIEQSPAAILQDVAIEMVSIAIFE